MKSLSPRHLFPFVILVRLDSATALKEPFIFFLHCEFPHSRLSALTGLFFFFFSFSILLSAMGVLACFGKSWFSKQTSEGGFFGLFFREKLKSYIESLFLWGRIPLLVF
eukprot:TRINITY_DN3365_c2_g1_i1.p1 TRINITY_DN3365_c2_g1~~TRINITY_DN3365_c2_g1_i1.p1  ORF type:complete len:109 (+),score=2.12 TRINITY_DN3365_c2_g1_i1:89-415(+)